MKLAWSMRAWTRGRALCLTGTQEADNTDRIRGGYNPPSSILLAYSLVPNSTS